MWLGWLFFALNQNTQIMASCPQCKEVVSPQDKLCKSCGERLEYSNCCQACGQKFNNATEKFCSEDGTPRLGFPLNVTTNGTSPNDFPQTQNWECSQCTFLNDMRFAQCEMCETDRPFFSSSSANISFAKAVYPMANTRPTTSAEYQSVKQGPSTKSAVHQPMKQEPTKSAMHQPMKQEPIKSVVPQQPIKQEPTSPPIDQEQEIHKAPNSTHLLRRPSTKPYNILVIGQTGSGKSTFVNMVCNYFRNGSVAHPRVLISTKYFSSTESDSQKCEYSQSYFSAAKAWVTGVSQTLRPVTYKFQDQDTGCMFNIIDTPGLGDTRGIAQDEANIEGILVAASELEYLDSICIVANGSMAKLDPGLKMVLERFRANLPNSVRKNSVLILTNCEELSANFDVGLVQKHLLGDCQDKMDVFHMNNFVFSTDPKRWDAKSIEGELKPSWNESMETITLVVERISSRTEVSTQDFKKMKIIRGNIKTEMAAVMNCIKNGDALRKRIVDFEAKSQNCANNALKYADFKRTETFQVDVQESTSDNNVVCNTCKANCHESCDCWFGCICYTSSYIPFIASTPKCTKCGCDDDHHAFAKSRWKKETRSVEKVMNSVKEKFDDLRRQSKQTSNDKDACEKDLKMLQKSSDSSMQSLKSLAESLKELCDGINLSQELQATIDCWMKELEIEQNPQTKRDIEKRIKEMRSFIQIFHASESNQGTKNSATTSTFSAKQYSLKEIIEFKRDGRLEALSLDATELEHFLTDAAFKEAFKQSRNEFHNLSPWIKMGLKKKANLF